MLRIKHLVIVGHSFCELFIYRSRAILVIFEISCCYTSKFLNDSHLLFYLTGKGASTCSHPEKLDSEHIHHSPTDCQYHSLFHLLGGIDINLGCIHQITHIHWGLYQCIRLDCIPVKLYLQKSQSIVKI